jgi:hypothetical protein
MKMIERIKKLFLKKSIEQDAWTEWELIHKSIPSYIEKDGKSVIRIVNIYERYNPTTDEYETRREYFKSVFMLDNL